MSLVWSAYRIAAPLIGAAAPAARAFAPLAERRLWGERMGRVDASGTVDAWIHAASLGEALAVGPLVRELERMAPGARFHLTATTASGRARLGTLGPPSTLAPLDVPQAVSRFMAALEPKVLFLIETELWPHWLLAARAARVPVVIVSARLSAGSVPRYRLMGGRFRSLMADLGAVLAQSEADAERWRELGAPAPRTAVVGNLKDDALPGPVSDRSRARAELGLDPDRPLLVLGNLRPGETQGLALAWRVGSRYQASRWQVVAVPRHPHASARLKREARMSDQAIVDEGAPPTGAWRWDDRLGVLGAYYGAADLAVLGGTFLAYGGHNPLEPAARGVPVLLGAHYASQAAAVEALIAAGAARDCRGMDALAANLAHWLASDQARHKAGEAALAVVAARRGAAARAVARLAAWGLWPAA